MPKEEKEQLVPNLRFKGFTDDWIHRIFLNMLDKKDGIRRGPFGSALKKEYFVKESDYVVYEQRNAIDNHYETRYNISKEKFDELHRFVVQPGDFLMSGAGTIGRISRVPENIKNGVFNQALIRLKLNYKLTDPDFFIQWMRSDGLQRRLTQANPASAMANLIPMSELKNWKVLVPNQEEQSKLGVFISKIDKIITLEQEKRTFLKSLKKYLITNLFADEDRIPKLRFSSYSEKWDQFNLIDIGKYYNGLSGKTKIDFGHGDAAYIVYKNIHGNPIADKLGLDNVEVDSKQNEVLYGDILFTTSSETPEEVGLTSVWISNQKNVYLNSFSFGFRPNIYINPYFIAYYLRSNYFREKIIPLAQGISRYNISRIKVMELPILLPKQEEQDRIGDVFKLLDTSINANQEKLKRLKKVKSMLLQNLFV